MAAPIEMQIETRAPWWLGYYVEAIGLFCKTFGTVPDVEKAVRFALKHSRWRLNGGQWRRFV